jgi:hypothetical protein
MMLRRRTCHQPMIKTAAMQSGVGTKPNFVSNWPA